MAGKATEVVIKFLGETTGFDGAVDKLQKSTEGFSKNVGKAFQAGGAAVGTFGVLVTKMAAEGEQDQARLTTAIKNTGGSYDDFSGRIDKTIKSMNKFGADNNDTQQALTKLVNATHDTNKALDQMQVVADLAAAKHISLAEAAGLVAKVDMGKGAKALAEFGIASADAAKEVAKWSKSAESADAAVVASQKKVEDANQRLEDLRARQASKTSLTVADQQALRNAENAVKDAVDVHSAALEKQTRVHAGLKAATDNSTSSIDELAKVVQGQAAAQADTLQGKFDAVSAKARDMAEAVGAKMGPALVVAGPLMSGLGTIMTSSLVPSLISSAAAGWAAVAPWIPFIAIAAAVGVAIYALYRNWDTVTNAMAVGAHWLGDVFAGVWDGIVGGFVWVANNLKSLANWIVDHTINPAIDGINLLIRGYNLLPGHADVPQLSHLPKFHSGGVIPGPVGTEVPIMAQAGETVIPIGGAGDAPAFVWNQNAPVIGANTRELRDLFVSLLNDHFARGGALSNGRGGTLAPGT